MNAQIGVYKAKLSSSVFLMITLEDGTEMYVRNDYIKMFDELREVGRRVWSVFGKQKCPNREYIEVVLTDSQVASLNVAFWEYSKEVFADRGSAAFIPDWAKTKLKSAVLSMSQEVING